MNAFLHCLQSSIGSLRNWVVAGILALGSLDAAAQAVAPLFTPPPGGDAAGVRAAAKRAADRPYIARQRAVGVDFQQLQPQAGRNSLALSVDLFDGVTLLADLDRVDVRGAQSYSWFGRVRGLPNSRATLTVVNGILAGNLIVLDDWNRVKGSYQIQSAGDGLYFLEEINQGAFPPDHPPGIDAHPPMPRVSADAPTLRDTAKADTISTIDVLVVYSNETASAAGSAIGAQIQAAVDSANVAYANSGINARLRLVHYAPANYPHSGNFSTDLSRLTSTTDGYMDDVHALRDTYGADMVSLWVEGGQYCGIGWVGPYASYAFTVVNRGCATSNLTFAHELGHNMGALHDAYVDPGTSPYAYGHGHINLVSRWRTVMSYNDLCAATAPGTSCARIPYFSNPSLTYGGAALGTAEAGTTPTANNARVHNNVAATVAAFRPTVVGTPCTYTVSPTTASPTAAGGTATATVTTQSGCTWTATSSAAWLTISSGASGTGSGTVTYASAANTGAARSAALTVAGKTVTVNQAAACNYALSPTSASLTAAAGSGSVGVTVATGCSWTATSSASWLTVTSGASGNGNGTVGYSASANTGPTRSANLTIGGQTFMVTQANGCTYVASPTSISPTASATTGSVTVTAGTGCTWTASSNASWLTVTSGASGSGTGSVGYSVAANTGAARAATLTVGGKTVTVSQAALTCNYTFAPTSGSFTAGAGSSSVAVTVATGCAWTATSSASWLTVTSGASGNGNGTVGFAATANTGPARSANLTIGGQSYAVTQANGCTYVASPTSVSAAAGTGSGSVAVTAGTGCTWTASSSASWLTVTSGASGSGNGNVGYAIAANTGAARSATLNIGGNAVAFAQPAPVTATPTTTVSPTTLDFGGQSISTKSPAYAVTLTNMSESAVAVNSVATSIHFEVAHNCTTLVAGGSCTAAVTFVPGAEGILTGTVTLTTSLSTHSIALSGIGERSLVTHYYRSILRRAPEPAGKAAWESRRAAMESLGADVNEVWYAMATSFFFSNEYRNFNRDDTGFVTDLYSAFLNRAPEAQGLENWTGLLSQGIPREVVLTSFMFSTEFTTIAQSLFGNTPARYEVDIVMDFYRGLLSRLPDSAGFDYWLRQVRAAQCTGELATAAAMETMSKQFTGSPEYLARSRSNAQYVGDLFNALLRRGGDQSGVQYWIQQLDTGALTREGVRSRFIEGSEFKSRVNELVAQGCLM